MIKKILITRKSVLELGSRTLIMGILNVTPDSFFDGGNFQTVAAAAAHARQMEKDGADIIDIGGESTRPGAEPVSITEEKKRILPIIKALRQMSDIPISIDTYKAEIAAEALAAGADIINDISAMTFDSDMPGVVRESGTSVILMHIQGSPKNMQKNPIYTNVVTEIATFLKERIYTAKSAGIEQNRIIIDPGIGFGKSLQHNFIILKRLQEFRQLECPILIGLSRKSFLSLEQKLAPNERLITTAAANAAAILNGADILRVHDVKETDQVRRIIDSIKNISD
jgi:dihydropteroate synthase